MKKLRRQNVVDLKKQARRVLKASVNLVRLVQVTPDEDSVFAAHVDPRSRKIIRSGVDRGRPLGTVFEKSEGYGIQRPPSARYY